MENNFDTIETVDVNSEMNLMDTGTDLIDTTIVSMEPVETEKHSLVGPCLISFGAGVLAKIAFDLIVTVHRKKKAQREAEAAEVVEQEESVSEEPVEK